ncbi:hypothetical protein NQ317_017056 [Molorchus minor]|uniref:L-aminoadipate-semialdehyde dehydrogenase-phosphopantetheinyl transferase n=1 Tax=Molorchus minor TaxID=1323400 RepID=A0ABQ9K4B9_9CUCU|nr:hypothetical protein NQ317_017056 [Molorchus minor]
MTNNSIRWAFNFAKWNPSYLEMAFAFSIIQSEEKERLMRFVFKKDVKASLLGRLMMRKFISESTGKQYEEILIARDDRGKPFFEEKDCPRVYFNVSHQGSFTVLAGEVGDLKLGVDVMKLEYTGGKPLNEFFTLMSKHFSLSEWDAIKDFKNEHQQIYMFCRLWCLKESYVKAVGVGITVNLGDISFKINSKYLNKYYINKDTELYVKGNKLDWVFEEMLIDDEHCVSVALSKNTDKDIIFKQLDFEYFKQNCVPMLGDNAWSAQESDFDQYFIIDLGRVMNVTRVWTRGRPHSNEYVMEYRISYGTNDLDYADYKESGGDIMVSKDKRYGCRGGFSKNNTPSRALTFILENLQ